jgi:ATP-dependent exoDNAse (exonuclease V) beta subunit
LIKEIKDIYSDSKLTPKTREKVEYVLERWNASSMQKEVEELYGQTKKNLPTSPPYEGGERGVVKSTEIPSDIKQSSERDDLILALLNRVKGINSVISLSVSKDVKTSLGALREELKTLTGLLAEDYSTSIKMVLRDFLVNFDIAYSERKKAEGLIDFTDLEVKTIELLENREYIANEIKRKFKYILVDEFQDISGLQKKIIDLISSLFMASGMQMLKFSRIFRMI